MQVVAVNTSKDSCWRWRIINYAGETVAESRELLSDHWRCSSAGGEKAHRDECHRSVRARQLASFDISPAATLKRRLLVHSIRELHKASRDTPAPLVELGHTQSSGRDVGSLRTTSLSRPRLWPSLPRSSVVSSTVGEMLGGLLCPFPR